MTEKFFGEKKMVLLYGIFVKKKKNFWKRYVYKSELDNDIHTNRSQIYLFDRALHPLKNKTPLRAIQHIQVKGPQNRFTPVMSMSLFNGKE